MQIKFSKYQGTGNDFILLNNLSGSYDALSVDDIKLLCNRRFGIGADGLIKINQSFSKTFEMDYYNSDGSKSFCGNGARCAVAFTETLGIEVSDLTFDAFDGSHLASKTANNIKIQMGNVENVHEFENEFELDEVREILATAPGIILVDDPATQQYPMPMDAHEKDEVFVGRLRRDLSQQNTLNMWIVSDNLRKGAATNAIQIAEYLVAHQLV